jgi:hypothetical protein
MEIARGFGLSHGEVVRQAEELNAETPNVDAIIREYTEVFKHHLRYSLGLGELINSIIAVVDDGDSYVLIMRLQDPVTEDYRDVEVRLKKKTLSYVLDEGVCFDYKCGDDDDDEEDDKDEKKELGDPTLHVPALFKPHLIDFAIAHRTPMGFISINFVEELLRIAKTKLISNSKIDVVKLILIKWLTGRVYVNVTEEGGTRVATVKSVPPTEAIYLSREKNQLLVPPQAYLPSLDASEKQRVTVFLKTMDILKDTRGHYPIHVNDTVDLEYFYVLDLKGLEGFVGYTVENLAKPDRAGLLINQSVIEELRREFEGGVTRVCDDFPTEPVETVTRGNTWACDGLAGNRHTWGSWVVVGHGDRGLRWHGLRKGTVTCDDYYPQIVTRGHCSRGGRQWVGTLGLGS